MGRPLRIGLVVERFAPRGGVEGIAWAVAHGLAEAGDEVTVFCRRAEGDASTPASDTRRAPRVRRVRVPSAWQPARVLAFSAATARATRQASLDVVQSFSRTRHQDVYRAGGGCHARYMLRAYGPRGAAWQRLSPRHAVLLGMERRIFGDPSQVVLCNSAMVEAEIRAEHGVASERMVMIPNGVDLARFHPDHRATLRDPTRARIGAGDAPAWLLLGSGFARKGVDTALRALAAARSPRSELWIAGGDEPRPWRDLAESLGVASRTRFLGPRDDAPALCAAADGLLLPTRYDAFANACLEAAAAGLPVVTSGANGAAGFLGEAARVVADPEDVEGFAHALDSLDDAAARRALGAAARQRAETASWERHVQALRALYQRLPS